MQEKELPIGVRLTLFEPDPSPCWQATTKKSDEITTQIFFIRNSLKDLIVSPLFQKICLVQEGLNVFKFELGIRAFEKSA
jgi:hypothetical protein